MARAARHARRDPEVVPGGGRHLRKDCPFKARHHANSASSPFSGRSSLTIMRDDPYKGAANSHFCSISQRPPKVLGVWSFRRSAIGINRETKRNLQTRLTPANGTSTEIGLV